MQRAGPLDVGGDLIGEKRGGTRGAYSNLILLHEGLRDLCWGIDYPNMGPR